MQYDKNNKIVKLCASGMELEGQGKNTEALELFFQAWIEARNDLEKFTAAHYIARHQNNLLDKLKWDQTALSLALKINDANVKGALPSLYLNVAKCYEDLNDFINARKNYEEAKLFTEFLPLDGYGNMIRKGITNGLDRVSSF
jgi:tetratricopeptide (TPR) repeat protein